MDVEVESETPNPASADDPDPDDLIDAEVATDIVPADETDDDSPWKHEDDWPYDELEFKGDRLAVRIPNANALTALYQASSTCSEEFQMKLTSIFVKRHISEATRERVLERMSDPDDTDFTDAGVWSELLTTLSQIGGQRAVKEAEARAAIQAGKSKK